MFLGKCNSAAATLLHYHSQCGLLLYVETSSVVYSISRRILKHEHAQKHPPHLAPPPSYLAGLYTGEGKRHLSGTPLPSQPRHHLPYTWLIPAHTWLSAFTPTTVRNARGWHVPTPPFCSTAKSAWSSTIIWPWLPMRFLRAPSSWTKAIPADSVKADVVAVRQERWLSSASWNATDGSIPLS